MNEIFEILRVFTLPEFVRWLPHIHHLRSRFMRPMGFDIYRAALEDLGILVLGSLIELKRVILARRFHLHFHYFCFLGRHVFLASLDHKLLPLRLNQ
jgi:hypothetical protein